MTDWNLIANIAGSTWGLTILVCAIAWLVAWVMGLILRKVIKQPTGDKNSTKE
jgi:hypothetical protein